MRENAYEKISRVCLETLGGKDEEETVEEGAKSGGRRRSSGYLGN